MRLFTGLDVPAGPRGELETLIGKLRSLAMLRWSAATNLHVTTKFIGEWPESRLEELKAALAAVPAPAAITIRLDGLGWFPNPHQPRVFWVAVKAAGPELAALASATDRQLAERLGIAAETRAYTPHLTLARVDSRTGAPPPDLAPVRRAVAGLDSTLFGEFVARKFYLYLSEQAGGGSRYTKVASFPLGGSTG